MKWSKIEPPNILSAKHCCTMSTPIGLLEIEWNDNISPPKEYNIFFRELIIGEEETLEGAKTLAEEWLREKALLLNKFICS